MSVLAVARATGVRENERAPVASALLLFFCVFSSWYVLRPLRDAMGIAGSMRELPHLFLVTLGATLAATPILSALVSRLSRRRIVVVAYRCLVATLVAFFFLLRAAPPDGLPARAFFVWASVFNLLVVTLAWALMADVFTREQGVRLFALVGGGGTLGAIAGSAMAAVLARYGQVAASLLVSAVLLELGVQCVGRVARLARGGDPAHEGQADGGPLRWLGRTARDPFFLGICLYLALFTFSSTVLYLEQGRIVKAALLGTAERAELFARMDVMVNVVTLGLQVLVVGRVIRWFGVGLALASLPIFTLGCFVALRVAPALGVLVACQVSRRALDYALTKPAREVLFTVVRPEDKYKTKSFIDTFVYRSGDALGAVGFEHASAHVVLAGMAVVCLSWAVVGVGLGRGRPRVEAGVPCRRASPCGQPTTARRQHGPSGESVRTRS